MHAVANLWRLRFRRGWRAWVAITLLLALGTGVALACLAGARRTASSFDRIAQATEYPDLQSSHGLEPAEAAGIIDGFEGVAGYRTQVGFTGFVEGLDPALIKYFVGSSQDPLRYGRPILREGRYPDPDRPEEVLLIGRGVDTAGIEPGDELTVRFFLSDFSDMVSETFVVTGTGADALEVAADAGYDRSAIYFTPAFTDANAARLQAWSSTRFVTATGDEEDLASQILSVGWSVDENRAAAHARVQHAIRPLVVSLAVLGGLILTATLVLVGQALARRADADRRESDTVRALGFTRRQLGAVDLLTVLAIGLPGALLATVCAVALSPLSPVGAVRRLEPDRGAAADLTVLAWGAVAVVVLLVLSTGLGVRRGVRARRPPAHRFPVSTAPRPLIATGLRLAVGGTGPQRRRFWATLAFSATASGLVVAGIVFVSALERLTQDSARYGAGWDLTARNAYGEVPPDELRALLADDPDIEGVSGAGINSIIVDGIAVPGMAILPITTELWPTVVEGALPVRADEVLVGEGVLHAVGAEIGDTVTIESPYAQPGATTADVTIVGTAVFPSVELAGLDPARLGQGIALTWDSYQSLIGSRIGDEHPDIVFFDLADDVEPATVIDRYRDGLPELTGFSPTEWLPSLAPAEVLEADRAAPLIWTLIGLLGFTVLATIAHTLASGVRRHRRDYAILKTLGFTRRQVLSSVTSQSTVTMALALLVALPVGIAGGRGLWHAFVQLAGVIDTPVVPVLTLAALAAGGLLTTGLVSAGPGLIAARTPPAAVLAEE